MKQYESCIQDELERVNHVVEALEIDLERLEERVTYLRGGIEELKGGVKDLLAVGTK